MHFEGVIAVLASGLIGQGRMVLFVLGPQKRAVCREVRRWKIRGFGIDLNLQTKVSYNQEFRYQIKTNSNQ